MTADTATIPARRGIVMRHQDRQVLLLLHPCSPTCWVVTSVPRTIAAWHVPAAELVGACRHCGTFHATEPFDVEACADAQEAEYQADQAAARAERLRDRAGL